MVFRVHHITLLSLPKFKVIVLFVLGSYFVHVQLEQEIWVVIFGAPQILLVMKKNKSMHRGVNIVFFIFSSLEVY